MAHSLGLTLYNLRMAKTAAPVPDRPPRPSGRLIWMHAPGAESAGPILQLAQRMVDDDGVSVLVTCPAALTAPPGIVIQPPPADAPAAGRAFLDHWQPELAVFADGELRPALIHECDERKLPMMIVDGRAPFVLRERDGWYPGLMRSVLSSFSHVLAVDEPAARAFRKAGAPLSAVTAIGRLEGASAALPAAESDRAALARYLTARPVWFAASLPEAEEAAVMAAHRTALSHAHRLLLIIVPEHPARADALATAMETTEDWVVARRWRDEEPGPEVEVYIADNPAEYGLWYRLAPITFLGGSLSGEGAIRNPLEPAALGSAIIAGARSGPFGAAAGRLGAARAARIVASAADLAEALADLLSPDRAARMAQAAWSVTSDGAEATEQAISLIRRLMDGDG
jgi:3-deoxy-D-manno-octulosonic-acid transferase